MVASRSLAGDGTRCLNASLGNGDSVFNSETLLAPMMFYLPVLCSVLEI